MSAEVGGSKLTNIIKAKEDMNKTPEQLQSEKINTLKSRICSLRLDENKDKLIRQANSFHELLSDLYDIIYDLNEKHERQKYDMMELTKRAIQVEKGKNKTRKSNIVHTGLGGSIFPWIQEQNHNAPGKISLFSRYERVTDRRTFANRRDIWESPQQEKERRELEKQREKPKPKIVPAKVRTPSPEPEPEPEHHEEAHEEVEEHHEEDHHEEHREEEHHEEDQEEREHHEDDQHEEEHYQAEQNDQDHYEEDD